MDSNTYQYNPKANSYGAFPNVTNFTGETRLLTVGKECLVSVIKSGVPLGMENPARMLVAVTSDGYRTDYPISHDGKTVQWDNPEWFSKRFKERAKSHVFRYYHPGK